MPTDSTGKQVFVGDRVRFRGKDYTIRRFILERTVCYHSIEFQEEQDTPEVASEISIDKIF